jgi:molybdopterin-guanine dinucleotide biosynthesis protein A
MERTIGRRMIAGAVLAGGKSRRMGRDKALIEVGGVPLIAHMTGVLQAAGCSPVLAVGRQPGLAVSGVPVLDTESPLAHPLSGIVAALEHFAGAPVLFCPVDLPGLTALDVQLLLDRGRPCVATDGDSVQPLLCILGPEQLDRARMLLRKGGSARTLVAHLEEVRLGRKALHNCNQPHDFASI